MLKVSRPWSVSSVVLCLASCLGTPAVRAQAIPETPLQRQLDRLDLGVTAIGQITKSVSGTNYLNQPLTQSASTTVGVLATLRYTKSPLVGLEANFMQARYTENFSKYVVGGAQTRANEYSFGYVAHLPNIIGIQPFAAVGAGTMAFHPTAGGGQGLPYQYRAVYYYNVGVDNSVLSKHFGVRLSLRQAFYKAPDFLTNYL